ncbi:MAG: capsule assembly Wzi family protein, partial [bacterium]
MQKFLLIFFLFIIPAPVVCLEYLSLTSQTNRYISLLLGRGHLQSLNNCVSPYKISDIKMAMENQKKEELLPAEKQWFQIIKKDLSRKNEKNSDFKFLAGLEAQTGLENSTFKGNYDLKAGTGFCLKNLSGFTGARFQNDYRKEPSHYYPWKRDRITAGRIDQAYMTLNIKHADFFVGRIDRNWGPIPGNSLFLSPNHFSFDHAGLEIFYGRFTLNQVSARLDNGAMRFSPDPENPDPANRFFSAHRLDIIIKPNIRVGLCETIVYGGNGRLPELRYLNPFGIYLFSQINTESSGNCIIGLDFHITRIKNFNFYGQLAIDDFQVDNEAAIDQEPPIYGFFLGLDNLYGNFKITIFHKHLSDYLYNVQQ